MKDSEREALLTLFQDLRVCDVRDGMDALGYFHYGSLEPPIRPLWRTRAYGLAQTVRYLPYIGPEPRLSAEEYRREWTPMYYQKICPYPWCKEIKKGNFIVIDQSGLNVGLIGSANSLACFNDGAVGFLTNGGVRDTDEIILQKIPFWSKYIGQTMVQVRLQFDASNVPVAIEGVQIRPDDMVVADGDGVIVVPQEIADKVAAWAHEEHDQDKQSRREHYRAAGLEPDKTVE
jgi:4-hydroxy-4-methyl-2-oxoglutarate aldolase